jgi:chromosome segregation ATPase
MSRSTSPWRTLHGVVTRAIGRLERTLVERRAALAGAEEAAAQCAARLADADAALAGHAARLETLLAGTAVSPRAWLDHDAWRGQLVARQADAAAALHAAQQNILDKQNDIRQTRQEIAAATARLDDLARRVADEARAAEEAQQDAQDEEAAEAGLARRCAARMAEVAA